MQKSSKHSWRRRPCKPSTLKRRSTLSAYWVSLIWRWKLGSAVMHHCQRELKNERNEIIYWNTIDLSVTLCLWLSCWLSYSCVSMQPFHSKPYPACISLLQTWFGDVWNASSRGSELMYIFLWHCRPFFPSGTFDNCQCLTSEMGTFEYFDTPIKKNDSFPHIVS